MYHVYSRVTRREPVLREAASAELWMDVLRDIKLRDGFVVYAWCLMPSHHHLLVKTIEVPLWRSMASLHGGFTKRFNSRRGLVGPFWQGRYKAKLVQDQRYFGRLVVYVHLNPVTAGLVDDPASYPYSGHREILGKVARPLVDAEETLLGFGAEAAQARRAYTRSLRVQRDAEWVGEAPGRLPWWRFGRSPTPGDEVRPRAGVPFLDELGRSSGRERPHLAAADLVSLTCEALGVERERLVGATQERPIVRAREAMALLAIERYQVRATDLAAAVGKKPDTVSRWLSRAAARRRAEPSFADLVERLDAGLAVADSSPSLLV